MFISRKHISRREVLRGMGVTVALPFLEAMVPARAARAQTAPRKIRFAAIEMVHGAAGSTKIGIEKNMWSPAATGRAFDLTPTSLSPLDPFRDHLTIISNTDVRNAEAFEAPEIGGDHFRSSAVFLTQMHPRQTQGSDVRVGTSLDQVLRAEVRPGYGDPVLAAVHRERRSGRRLLLRLLLRLHRFDQLGLARPIRCRWCATRARCSTCCSASAPRRRIARAPSRGSQHPRLDRPGHVAPAQHAGRRRSSAAERLPRRHPRDRAAHSARRSAEQQRGSSASCRARPLAFPTRSRSTSS